MLIDKVYLLYSHPAFTQKFLVGTFANEDNARKRLEELPATTSVTPDGQKYAIKYEIVEQKIE